jgi:carbamoyltransferase
METVKDMKRYYIGLACTGHDNAAAVVNDQGEVVFAEGTERYLQCKRAVNCPPDNTFHIVQRILSYCDQDAEIVISKSWSDELEDIFQRESELVDERRRKLHDHRVGNLLAFDLNAYKFFIDFALNNVRNSGKHLEFFCHQILGRKVIKRNFNHHLTHAATACYTSPFSEAACMIVDGFGEGVSLSYYHYRDGAIKELESVEVSGDMMQSLGSFYASLCSRCGFDVWQGEEWKVMGLASYGTFDQQLYDLMRKRLQNHGLQISCPESGYDALEELLAYSRQPGSTPLTVADLAYTGQQVYHDVMIDLLSNFYGMGLSQNLIIGGGCGLNSSFNGQIIPETGFSELHLFAAPADDGNALGAALLAYHEDQKEHKATKVWQTPYLGSELSSETLDNVRQFSGIKGLHHLPGEIIQRTAELLAEGKIVGWIQGRAEFGPRALGNRSILADPRSADMKDRINSSVKFREEFRPFAPSILHEYGNDYFIDYQASPYMERTLMFHPEVRAQVPAVVHEDGTGRLHSVKREWNQAYYDLILGFFRITGVPILLNTSLNVMGKPIVHSVEDALAVFYTSGLDVLVMGDYLIEKSTS